MNKYIYPGSQQYFAFNIWSIETAKAVIDMASKYHCDVILQTSMRPFELLEIKELRAFVTSYMQKKNIHAYLHLDHCRKMDDIEQAVENGWDSVMIDASDRSLEENIAITKDVCSIAHEKGVLVEAEVGQIRGIEDEIFVAGSGIANIKDVEKFIQHVDVDMIAVAIGTAHGLYKGDPDLHYDLIKEVGLFTDVPMVVHGGTGLPEQAFLRLLSYDNIKKINISTEIKQAYRKGIEAGIQKGYLEENGFDPIKIGELINESLGNVVADKLKLLR